MEAALCHVKGISLLQHCLSFTASQCHPGFSRHLRICPGVKFNRLRRVSIGLASTMSHHFSIPLYRGWNWQQLMSTPPTWNSCLTMNIISSFLRIKPLSLLTRHFYGPIQRNLRLCRRRNGDPIASLAVATTGALSPRTNSPVGLLASANRTQSTRPRSIVGAGSHF